VIADNDLAVGRVVEAVSYSPYWDDTAIFILEDDAQDGPDHVDAHRSSALNIRPVRKSIPWGTRVLQSLGKRFSCGLIDRAATSKAV